jgi:hypothetical protein
MKSIFIILNNPDQRSNEKVAALFRKEASAGAPWFN